MRTDSGREGQNVVPFTEYNFAPAILRVGDKICESNGKNNISHIPTNMPAGSRACVCPQRKSPVEVPAGEGHRQGDPAPPAPKALSFTRTSVLNQESKDIPK